MLRPTGLLVLATLLTPAASAQTPDTLVDSLARRVAQLNRELAALRREVEDLAALVAAATPGPAPDQRLRQTSGIGTRPFLYRGAAAGVGGYVDLEFTHDYAGGAQTFTQHRLIPFIFAEISDRLHFGTEIEFEYGGPDAGGTKDGEVKVEFAAFDLSVGRALNFRAGAVLAPLGKFNLVHDSPVNDLTDRPLVDSRIVPTTLTEAGAGVFGQLYPNESSVLTYEAYVVNGFNNGLITYDVAPTTGVIRATTAVRPARGSMRRDNNPAKSLVGRVAFSPALGIEVGASGHTGLYSDGGSGRLTIAAFDAIVARGRWEVLGEAAMARLTIAVANERDRAQAAYVAARGDTTGFGAAYDALRHVTAQHGAYLQFNYHFLQGAVRGFPNSTFTGVVRVDHVDSDGRRTGGHEQRLSLGVNWRPLEQSAVKLDYQWVWATPPGATRSRPPAHRLVASVATYF